MLNTVIGLLVILAVGAERGRVVDAESRDVEPLPEKWSVLSMVTGFHSVTSKKAGLSVRVLESDGSASVAEDPVSLFIVATNNGTSDIKQRVWRLPEGVERVRKVTASRCGLDIVADVDSGGDEGLDGRLKTKSVTIKTCFLTANGGLESRLRVDRAK